MLAADLGKKLFPRHLLHPADDHAAPHADLRRPAAAFRLPAFALSALVPALTFLLGSAVYGRTAGLFAALSFLLGGLVYAQASDKAEQMNPAPQSRAAVAAR